MMKNILTALFLFCAAGNSYGQIISTIAGNDTTGYNGDNIPATAAWLDHPTFLVFDGSGNILFADTDNDRIRKITPEGIITTIAGTGAGGYNGDGISATDAKLGAPVGVAMDGAGNLYIADNFNHRIRKVNTAGIISTIAGTGTAGFSGDNGAATAAELNYPHGIAVDASGNILIADSENDCVRKVTPTGIITTVAGKGINNPGDGGSATAVELRQPYGVALDLAGNLYITEWTGFRVRKVNAAGIITTVAGVHSGGIDSDNIPATNAQLGQLSGIAIDGVGTLYICDVNKHKIRAIGSNGIIKTIAGTGTAGFTSDGVDANDADLRQPHGIAVNGSGDIFFSEYGNDRIRRFKSTVSVEETRRFTVNLSLYPNPSRGSLTLFVSSPVDEKVTVHISDLAGKRINEITAKTNSNREIELNAPNGVYLLTAITTQATVSTKIVLIH